MNAPRVASLLPSATETLFGISAGDCVVGVTHECDRPLAALERPILTRTRVVATPRAGETHAAAIDRVVNDRLDDGGGLYDLDVERLEALMPTLIVTQALCDVCAVAFPLVERAAAALPTRPPVLSLEPATYADVERDVERIGAAIGRDDGARALVAAMRARIDAARRAVAGAAPRRVVLLEWTDPPFGGGHWQADLLERAGGLPRCAFPGAPSATLTWEQIEAADPEVVIIAPCGIDLAGTREAIAELGAARPAWRRFAADRRVVAIDGNHYVNRPGPSLAETVELYAAAIHPERVRTALTDAIATVEIVA